MARLVAVTAAFTITLCASHILPSLPLSSSAAVRGWKWLPASLDSFVLWLGGPCQMKAKAASSKDSPGVQGCRLSGDSTSSPWCQGIEQGVKPIPQLLPKPFSQHFNGLQPLMHRVMGTQKLRQILTVTEPCWMRDLRSNLATGHDELHMLEATARAALTCWTKSALGKCLAKGFRGCSLKMSSLPSEEQYLREETGASLEIPF